MSGLKKIFNWTNNKKLTMESSVSDVCMKKSESKKFFLHLDKTLIGELTFTNNIWYFKYSDEFIERSGDFNLIVGFPDLKKVYMSNQLWPFFKIRIPGLKQPRVKEILREENIDIENHVKLLERFGKRTISNPYELEKCI